MSKFRNKLVFYDRVSGEAFERRPQGAPLGRILKFDSKLEFEVYQTLRLYAANFDTKLQIPICLKPKTKYSAAVHYVVDFGICNSQTGELVFLVEVKGVLTPKASAKLQILEIVEPTIREKLLLVSRETNYYFGRKFPPSLSVLDFKSFLSNEYNVVRNPKRTNAKSTSLSLESNPFPSV